MSSRIDIPDIFMGLFEPCRYKVYYGGRGGAKSWSLARALIILAYSKPLRILCAREFQASIGDSVMALLADQIRLIGWNEYFYITKTEIIGHNGSRFVFKGLRFNVQEIKSIEGIDICWIEEAQSVSRESWEILRPTIRKENSEIWISFNPKSAKDPVYEDFVDQPPENCKPVKVLFSDNPYLPRTLDQERLSMLAADPEAYQNIWLGNPRALSNAVIFRGKCEVMCFDTPEKNVRFYHGLDFGFADDPTAAIRCYIDNDNLYIDKEAWGLHIELDDLRDWLVDAIPTFSTWPINADNARPETISKLRKTSSKINEKGLLVPVHGINVKGAMKWKNSVEEGIQFLRGFKRIYIHEKNCPHVAEEADLYKYKTDNTTGEILPVPIDKYNHCWDAVRYAISDYIQAKMNSRDLVNAYGVKIEGTQPRNVNPVTKMGRRYKGRWLQ